LEEMPSQNMAVQRLKVTTLPLDLPCCGLIVHSEEILTPGKSHNKNPDGLFPKDEVAFHRIFPQWSGFPDAPPM
jgi:hypothetical protein